MDNGYVYAYRRAWHHKAFRNFLEAAVFNYLYQNAVWSDEESIFNGCIFQLKRGEIVSSIKFLSEQFFMKEKEMRELISRLIKFDMLHIEGTNKGTIITICNYDEYQPGMQEADGVEDKTSQKQNGNKTETKGEQKANKEAITRGVCDMFTETKRKQNGNKRRTKGELYIRIKETKEIKEIKVDKKKNTKKENFSLPHWIPAEDWNDFMEMRQKIRKPPTERAMQLLVNELDRLCRQGNDVTKVLQQSTLNNWQGLFEIKGQTYAKSTKSNAHDNFTAGIAAALDELSKQ